MNKLSQLLKCVGWNYLAIPRLQRFNYWSLGMDKKLHPTFTGQVITYLCWDYMFVKEAPGGRLNKKDGLTRYVNSHVKDKTS